MSVAQAHLRFYGELNMFLAADQRQVTRAHPFRARVAVKDLIEACGVPHAEVDLLLVNGRPETFSYILSDNDRVSVYPGFRTLDVSSVSLVRPIYPREPRFLLDTHLGALAAHLRMAGFDAAYSNDARDEDLAAASAAEHRILLTRDVGLLKRSAVRLGAYVAETAPPRQFLEAIRRFDLAGRMRPFSRCLRCNAPIEPCAREVAIDSVPPISRAHYDEFWRCGGCRRVYWKGSHYQRMSEFLRRVLEEARAATGQSGPVRLPPGDTPSAGSSE